MTTNAVELWHAFIKKHANDEVEVIDRASCAILICTVGKAQMMTFFLSEAATHVIRIGDQWKNWIHQKIIEFRIIIISKCQECSHFRKFFYFVQKFIVDQWKLAVKDLADGKKPTDELSTPRNRAGWIESNAKNSRLNWNESCSKILSFDSNEMKIRPDIISLKWKYVSTSFHSNEKKFRHHFIFLNRFDKFFEISIAKFEFFSSHFNSYKFWFKNLHLYFDLM